MKLFGRNRDNKTEEKIEELLPEEQNEAEGPPVADPGELVLDIEGLDAQAAEETVQSLRGATKILPDKKEIEEAVALTQSEVDKDAEAAVKEAVEAVEEAAELVEAAEPVEAAEHAAADDRSELVSESEPEAEKETETEKEPEKETEPEAEKESQAEGETVPEKEAEAKLSSVSYASVAQAMVNAKKEPTGRFERDAVDDETLLAELYALIGDSTPKKTVAAAVKEEDPVQTRPAPRPAVRITPETLQDAPEEFIEVEEDTAGIPGWLKGVFILLISLLLSAMTFYAVASDVIGKIF